ncbi:TonB-dependent receptor [Bernardetia sp. MNP-M8]|uniref:TonB-dependent receptor plug domain-containing protein n=1 Tax=Bernardetia sp. MNP-M8 TaxID=3127470 RepID=UPI0030D32F7F
MLFPFFLYAQKGGQIQYDSLLSYQSSIDDILELPKKDKFATEIYSASRQYENLFDVPLSASVLSREEIEAAGCLSIPEAMRLIPGVIVREMSNGNYDIHLRGMDNISPNNITSLSLNTSTLVMVNNRIVHNFLTGSTVWHALPIVVSDIEQIEVIRGTTSVLYGTNAVSGVINIITTQEKRKGYFGTAQTTYGSHNSVLNYVGAGYKSEKLSIRVSGNTQRRERYDNLLYHHFDNSYVPIDSLKSISTGDPLLSFKKNNRNTDIALEAYSFNVFSSYDYSDNLSFNVDAGFEKSNGLTAYADNRSTILSYLESQSSYLRLNTNYKDLGIETGYIGGSIANESRFETYDIVAEYNFRIGNKLRLKPLLNYREATFDDKTSIILQGKEVLKNYAAGLSANYAPTQRWRIVLGIHVDAFNNPSDNYFSYQSAVTYKPSPKLLVRAGVSRAYRAPLFVELYFNERTVSQISEDPLFSLVTTIQGNTELKLLQGDLWEAGLRYQISEKVDLNVEIFRSKFSNYTEVVRQETTSSITPEGEIIGFDPIIIQNVALEALQHGITVSSDIVTEKWQFKPYLTLQTTELKNYSPYLNTSQTSELILGYDPLIFNINTTEDKQHESTPALFGGVYFNYLISSKLNINTLGYFLSSQTYYHRQNTEQMDGVRGIYPINSKLLLNLTARYRLTNKINSFISIKNILGDNSVEYAKGEHIGRSFWAGFSISI